MKTVIISQCSECPHHSWMERYDEDGYCVINKASCKILSKDLDYLYYSGFKLSPDTAFPEWCPLVDEP